MYSYLEQQMKNVRYITHTHTHTQTTKEPHCINIHLNMVVLFTFQRTLCILISSKTLRLYIVLTLHQ